MSGIAELLANLDYTVTGSDEKRSAATDRLQSNTANAPRQNRWSVSWRTGERIATDGECVECSVVDRAAHFRYLRDVLL